MTDSSSRKTRALVLGGGGPVGVGWELGIAAGLAASGVSLADADLVIGTSAGSLTGAMLKGGEDPIALAEGVEALFAQGVGDSGADEVDTSGFMALMEMMISATPSVGGDDEAARLAEVGRVALDADTIAEEAFVGALGSTLAGRPWPTGFSCTAVDTGSGEFTIWDQESDVALERAVASSCSVPGIYPPVTIDGRRYMDGGVRSPLNADLAEGYDSVIVVSVMMMELPPGISEERLERFFATQQAGVDHLRDGGSKVELVVPDIEFLGLSGMGMSLMDFGLVGAAADAGARLGKLEADRLGAIW